MKFKKAKQNRIFQDIVDQIEKVILDGQLKPGERLPAERELCDQFKASRGTLREALRILEQKGLVEIRLGAGGGAFVRDIGSELMTENMNMLIRSNKISLPQLGQFRENLEATVASLAAKKANEDDRTILKKKVIQAQRHKENGTEDWDQFVKVEDEIHQEIGRIAENPIYDFFLEAVYDNINRYYDRSLLVGESELNENFQDLRMLVYAICRNDDAWAARLAREHVLRVNDYMEMKKRTTATA